MVQTGNRNQVKKEVAKSRMLDPKWVEGLET